MFLEAEVTSYSTFVRQGPDIVTVRLQTDSQSQSLTEPAAGSDSGEAPHEVLASQTEQAVEVVIRWDVYLEAVRVLQVGWPVATLLRLIAVQWVCNHSTHLAAQLLDQEVLSQHFPAETEEAHRVIPFRIGGP